MARPGQAPATTARRPGRHTRPGRAYRGVLQGLGVLLVALVVTVVTIVLVRDLVLEAAKPPAPGTGEVRVAEPADRTSAAATATTQARAAGWAGTWTVRAGRDTFVGYRVTQRLAGGAGRLESVGRTRAVTGRVVLTASAITEARVRADLRRLTSGDERRDDWVASHALRTDRYPTARFDLAEPVTLPERPEPGAVVAVRAPGRLTVNGVTRPVAFELEGRWVGSRLDIVGRTDIRLEEWGVEVPRVAGVASGAETARIELRLRLARG